jgi:PPM family protein phosphatase
MTDLSRSLRFGECTHRGHRHSNQDAVLSAELPDGRHLMAVADGMGGLAEGERASKSALAALLSSLSAGADLAQAVQEANAAVRSQAGDKSVGTTLVAALLDGNRADIVNVGDSRAYNMDALGLLRITRDHTMGEEARRRATVGEDLLPRPQDGSTFDGSPWAGTLARFLGAEDSIEADLYGPVLLETGDWLLLCSDGLHRALLERDLEAALRNSQDPDEAAKHLVEMALERQAEDNVSVVLVHFPQQEEEASVKPQDLVGTLPGTPPPASTWSPGSLFERSPRNEQRRRPALVVTLVLLGLLGALGLAYLALGRALFS